MLTFSGTSRVSPLTEVLWDRPIRGPDGWYRTSPRACKVPSVTSPDSLRAILMNRRTSWRSDSSSGIDGCTFRNLLEKKMEIFDIQIYWKSLAYMYYSWEYSKNFFNYSGPTVILSILICQVQNHIHVLKNEIVFTQVVYLTVMELVMNFNISKQKLSILAIKLFKYEVLYVLFIDIFLQFETFTYWYRDMHTYTCTPFIHWLIIIKQITVSSF